MATSFMFSGYQTQLGFTTEQTGVVSKSYRIGFREQPETVGNLGSSLNPNIHFNTLVLDGLYLMRGDRLIFHWVPPPHVARRHTVGLEPIRRQ